MTTQRLTRPWRITLGAAAALALLTVSGAATVAVAADESQTVRVVKDEAGQRLQVDGRDVMIFGMNWDYFPIGENYNFSLWTQPDDVIVDALAREMPLLQDMGINVIRQYVGIPARWVRYIYEHYGIYTILNHTVARYGYTLGGVWIPQVDYADPRLREAVTAEVVALVEEYRGTPGLLMWLLGNENNYGLTWTSAATEALPEGERDAARARQLYSLFGNITAAIHKLDPNHPVAIANGDVQYIDVIAQECRDIDIFGANVYRGISARDLFDVVKQKLDVPVLFTEFGADAYNARAKREDQATQARYLVGQWREIYEQSAGKGRAGNAIGGIIFQWTDGWWKYKQEERLNVHDTNASWPNGGYAEDFVEGENNMNEEWWGITAKGQSDSRGLYAVYPRAAYYALQQAFALDPYGPGTDLGAIAAHFHAIRPVAAEVAARGDGAALAAETSQRVRVAGVRMEFETFNTGGERIETPETPPDGVTTLPSFLGFDHLQSFYVDVEARPTEAVTGHVNVNILGNVPTNPIDEIFYENRGRARTVASDGEDLQIESLERVKVYQAAVTWDDTWFQLDGFYRTGHLHWGHEGDFFGLYRNAYYGENIDIYNGMAPIGLEIAGKRDLTGLKAAFGQQLWWGANPAVFLKYQRTLGEVATTLVYHEDIAPQQTISSSIAIPLPETRKISLQAATTQGPWTIELGTIWSGDPKVGQSFQLVDKTDGGYRVLQDEINDDDAWGFKGKLSLQRGAFRWYGQAAYMGLVADAGPTEVITYTGWNLKDSGSGNQKNVLTGFTYNAGDFQFGPNVLWQKPIVGPIPGDVPAPGRPRNVLDDPFAVRGNRETFGAEMMITWDPTPATWMWAWDNDTREDAPIAASLGFIYRDHKSTMDAAVFIAEDGITTYPFPYAPPAHELWEVRTRIASRLDARTRLVATLYAGIAEPNGWTADGSAEAATLNRIIHRYGVDARLTHGPLAFAGFVRINDWGPYDYHRDFNLTFPLQLMGDVSCSLGTPRWFGEPQTRLGVRGKWRSQDEYSPRYVPTGDGLNGSEWELQTYLHLSL